MSGRTRSTEVLTRTYFDVGRLELHLNNDPDLPKLFGKKILAVGGEYSHARGYSETRFVQLPAGLPEAQALAVELLKRFPGRDKVRGKGGKMMYVTCVIGRARVGPAGRVPQMSIGRGAEEQGIARLVGRVAGATFATLEREYDQRWAEAQARPTRLREERARLLKRIDEIDAELNADQDRFFARSGGCACTRCVRARESNASNG